VEPAPPAAPARKAAEAQPVTGSGFVVQLSSFRSAADARKEYGRLSSLYPSVVGGLQEQIRETSVGGSTRYQLGLGPLPSRSDATRVCSALITAGESDCIVRGR
jgi:cell division protein FtsN